MSDTKFTKGPWAVRSGDGVLDGEAKFPTHFDVLVFSGADCETHPIADCSCNHTCRLEGEQSANAHLIAAAPELYEALEAIVAEYVFLAQVTYPLIDADDDDCAVAARRALAKARGES